MKRLVLAALLGGLVVFIWGALSHMVLPLGSAGFSALPNEEAVLTTLRTSVTEPGLYFFPWMDPSDKSQASQDAWTARYRTGPAGLLVYKPVGGEPMEPRQLIWELVTDILSALIAAIILSRTVAPYFQRVVFVGALGLFGWLSLSLSYWIWYGFPASYICAEGIDQVVGWLIGGLVIARFAGAERT